MPKNSKKKCFIAMAFGHDDTDFIYQNYIHHAVEEAGFKPIRVDILNHNDRIDQRIRDEIQDSVVLIADLTYARPSVYWEAGFGERSVPVIYTARKDHFSSKESDTYGNFSVHFDLRNANIIPWVGEGSKKFKKDLLDRILLVTKGIRKDEEYQKKLELERTRFSTLAVAERRIHITKIVIELLESLNYRPIQSIEKNRSVIGNKGNVIDKNPLYWKLLNGTAYILTPCPCYSKLLKDDLRWIRDAPIINKTRSSEYVLWGSLPEDIKSCTRRRIRRIRRIRIVPSLSKKPVASTEDVFAYWRHVSTDNLLYRYILRNTGFIPDSFLPMMPTSSEVLFIDPIQSIYEFKISLEKVIKSIETSKVAICIP